MSSMGCQGTRGDKGLVPVTRLSERRYHLGTLQRHHITLEKEK